MARKGKRKINKVRVKRTIIWSLLMVSILALLCLSVSRKSQVDLEKVYISIKASSGSSALIAKKDVVQKIENHLGYDLRQAQVHDLKLREIEEILVKDPRVGRAEVYFDSNARLHIYVKTKKALARVKTAGVDYYLSEDGEVIPVKGTKIMRVPIITGIGEEVPDSFPHNKVKTILNDVFAISKAASEDDFVEALVEQIHVDEEGEVWVIPKIGKEKLLLGDSQELDDRMKRLKILYKEGMKRSGFNQYAELHLKWRGQVTRVKG